MRYSVSPPHRCHSLINSLNCDCVVTPITCQATAKEPREATCGDADVNGNVYANKSRAEDSETVQKRSMTSQQQQMDLTPALAARTAMFMSQLVPSCDGRLYHVSRGKVQELGMTIADIVNVNVPVRVAVDATVTGDEPAVAVPAADILIFGEKTLELFTLSAASGFCRAYLSSIASMAMSGDVLFGRSDFTT